MSTYRKDPLYWSGIPVTEYLILVNVGNRVGGELVHKEEATEAEEVVFDPHCVRLLVTGAPTVPWSTIHSKTSLHQNVSINIVLKQRMSTAYTNR